MTRKSRPVIVTTAHKGVFFGYATNTDGKTIKLTKARCAIYWNTKGGFGELASDGPNSGSRLGSEVTMTLRDITSVVEVTPKAARQWKSM